MRTNRRAKVSVVIPVYGVEKYIERCVRTLFGQTLDDMEFIFVNDCTPDCSIDLLCSVLEEFPQRKEQVRIINQPHNMGAAKAREVGIKAATGEYIIHCDSDDWVDCDMYRQMYEKAKADNLDYVICRSICYTDGINHTLVTNTISDNREQFIEDMLHGETTVSLCSRLVKAATYQSDRIMIPCGHMMEDRAYSIQIAYFSKSYGYVEGPLYYYFQHGDSVCGRKDEASLVRNFKDAAENMAVIEKFFKREGVYPRYSKALCQAEFVVMGFLMPLLEKSNKYRNMWMNTFPEAVKAIWRSPMIGFSLKVKSFLIYTGICPVIYRLKRIILVWQK